ncbi:MAG: phage holin family protein [Armatimonadetes bacterium]|nr:phage holin family protein [Armatimonadota bacterium]
MQLLLRWLVSAVALYITVLLGQALHLRFWVAAGLPGVEGVLLFVLILAVANAVLRPLVRLLTLPLSCLTFGLFAFVVNALMFWIAGQVADGFTHGFHVAGFEAPLFGSVVMGLLSGLINKMVVTDREKKKL